MKKTRLILSALAILLAAFTSHAQSIMGNVNTGSDALSYANVDIYKGEILVATVLADRYGNFNVKLDTGLYRCEINYAGHEPIVKEMRVRGDEKADFAMKVDEESEFKGYGTSVIEKDKAKAVEELSEESVAYDDVDMAETDMPVRSMSKMEVATTSGSGRKRLAKSRVAYSPDMRPAPKVGKPRPRPAGGGPQVEVSAGKLTAGEINDFSKWDLWKDISSNDLNQHQTNWEFKPQNRFMVQVTDDKKLPLADLKVALKTSDGDFLYHARTDNSGKAELWQSLSTEELKGRTKFTITIEQKGKTYEIKRAQSIDKGINTIELTSDCQQSQKVDIAFVVDATGSMGDEINFLKAELNDIMFQSKQISNSLNFSFANVFYRDRTDGYLTQVQDFTRVLSESAAFINKQRAAGGGDYEEAVEVGLDSAINRLSWSTDARARIVFLILDAPPHNTPEIRAKLRLLTMQAADKGIRIVPIAASGANKSLEYLMRSMALGTNGTYAFLTNHSGIGGQHMDPSTDSYEVELLNELMTRIIKSYTYMPDCEQDIPNLGLNYPDSVVVVNPIDTTSQDSSTLSIDNKPVEINWSYYPNPTKGIVNIKANVDIKELYITDLSGKVLQVMKDINAERKLQVDLSSYASGIYLIRYPVGKQWVSGKVILVR